MDLARARGLSDNGGAWGDVDDDGVCGWQLLEIKNELAAVEAELVALKTEGESLQQAVQSSEDGSPEQIQKKAAVAAVAFKFEKRKKETQLDFEERERVAFAKA